LKISSKHIAPVVFTIVLLCQIVLHFSGWVSFEREDENRTFQDSIDVDFAKLDKLPKEVNTYVDDNFTFRSPGLEFFHYLKFSIFGVSPHPDMVLVGKDGWFFEGEKDREIYEGLHAFSDNDLKQFDEYWQSKFPLLDSLGTKVYWIMCPMKNYVYEEKLPLYLQRPPGPSRSEILTNHLKPSFEINFINARQMLVDAKNEGTKVFYKMDNHWNYTAGQLVTQMLVDSISRDFPNKNIPQFTNVTWKDSLLQKGIQYQRIGVKSLSEIDRFPVFNLKNATEVKKYPFPPVKGFPYPWEYELRFKNKKIKNGLTLLMIRDSFSHQVIPFISESFEESVFIFDSWKYQINDSILRVVKPDVLVIMGLETHLESTIKRVD
jgi:alginate O-acetyltransferase complex protein AlgJ